MNDDHLEMSQTFISMPKISNVSFKNFEKGVKIRIYLNFIFYAYIMVEILVKSKSEPGGGGTHL